jgi:hypothetical protein
MTTTTAPFTDQAKAPQSDQPAKTTLEAALTRTEGYVRANWMAIAFLVIMLPLSAEIAHRKFPGLLFVASLVVCIFSVLALIGTVGDLSANRVRKKSLVSDLEEIALEEELSKIQGDANLKAAEKMLRASNFEVRRYYDLNLRQNRSVNSLGISCVLAGLAIMVYALYVIRSTNEFRSEVITAILGGLGTILANYVAVIYLKMNSSASEMMGAFHARLVVTQQLMLGNLIASRITDATKQQDTFAAMALKMVPGKDA